MIKATLTDDDGRRILMIGLSFGNLRKFLGEPGDTFIKIDGQAMGLPIDVLLFSGKTESSMTKIMKRFIGPDTVVHIDPKLRETD